MQALPQAVKYEVLRLSGCVLESDFKLKSCADCLYLEADWMSPSSHANNIRIPWMIFLHSLAQLLTVI